MKIPFYKYQGTGNDFVIINQLVVNYFNEPNSSLIQKICDRKFGIGADGLILLGQSKACDFKMTYFNSDGRQSTMCGNGGRCLAHLARQLGVYRESCTFEAIDGIHEARALTKDIIEIKMNDVWEISNSGDGYLLDTGSPHYVVLVDNIDIMDVWSAGRKVRYSETFKEHGVNVNFIQVSDKKLKVRTYERGVEDETLSCGTGVTAAALVASGHLDEFGHQLSIPISTKGGELSVRFKNTGGRFTDIWLLGPAVKVFEGNWEL